jgi:hypothetical protein
VSDFGDHDAEDAYDTAPVDPEQLARRIEKYRRDHGLMVTQWEDLSPAGRLVRIAVAVDLLAWGRRSGFFR